MSNHINPFNKKPLCGAGVIILVIYAIASYTALHILGII